MGSRPGARQTEDGAYVTGLTLPIDFVQDPSNADVQYIVQQGGRIRVISRGVLQAADFLNLTADISSGGERGLLGLAFPPDYGSSGRFFVNFTNPAGHTVIARFKRSAGNPFIADPISRVDLRLPSGLKYIEQPFSNRKGGHLAFGPDGYLYIGLGDGGSGNDRVIALRIPTRSSGRCFASTSRPTIRRVPHPTGKPVRSTGPIAALEI